MRLILHIQMFQVKRAYARAVLSIVRDTIKPLPADVQDFILQLHQRYMDKGLTCVVEVKGFHIV